MHGIAANEGFFAVFADDERTIRTLIDQHEFIAVEFQSGVQPRDQIALDDEVVLLGSAHGDARTTVFYQNFLALIPQAQAQSFIRPLARSDGDGGYHAGYIVGLPQHLEKRHLAAAALEGCDVDLTHGSAPLARQPLYHRGRGNDLARLGLTGHAVRGVHG